MKKIFLLLCTFTLVLTSCNKDDDKDTPALVQDQLIGTWKFFKYFENTVEVPLEPCENQQTLVINADGTFTNTFYVNVSNNCEFDEAFVGTWNNAANGLYFLVDETSDTDPLLITFEGNTFSYSDTFNNGTGNMVEKYVFKRQ